MMVGVALLPLPDARNVSQASRVEFRCAKLVKPANTLS